MSLFPIGTPHPLAGLKRRRSEPLRLLVSVRDAEEARVAVAAGVEVIDVKEPSRGALGKADAETLHEIADAVRGRAVLSFAAGEAIDRADSAFVADSGLALARSGYSLFKYGPAGLALRDDWRDVLTRAWQSATTEGISPIAVVYVDYDAAQAPPPEAIIDLAIERGCFGVLFDTYGKAPRLGLTALPHARLRRCIAKASDAGLLIALAGSLGVEDVASVAALGADVIAVRGAACLGDRMSRVDATRIAALKEAIARVAASSGEFDVEAGKACVKDRA